MSKKDKIIIGFIILVFALGITATIWSLANPAPQQQTPSSDSSETRPLIKARQ